ncbi:MAG: phosphoglucomutase/phosphomannomutase family protein [Candidatus Omnitrophota bacterium]
MKTSKHVKPQIKFGTDGWRGVIADNFTFGNVRIVAQAIADYVRGAVGRQRPKVALGYDTRFLSDKFARAIAEVLAANDIRVLFSSSFCSTPMLSLATRDEGCCLGVMITASHNPPQFNGVKIKNARGGSADISITRKVEGLLARRAARVLPWDEAVKHRRVVVTDLRRGYVRFLRNYLDMRLLRRARFNILQDVMFGSGNGLLKDVLARTSIKAEFLHNEINPAFGGRRPEPLAENLSELISQMRGERFDLGLVLDGDADRIAAVAPGGRFIHPQQILALILLHLKEDRGWDGALVKTIAGTTMLDKIAAKLDIEVRETPIGFKHISRFMERDNILAGGEEAGGIGVKNYIPERDGLLVGLLLAEMCLFRKKGINRILGELEREFGRYYYVRDAIGLNKITFDKDKMLRRLPAKLLGRDVCDVKTYDGIKIICSDGDWLMLRGSGTEPIVRVYAEAKSLAKAQGLVSLGRRMITGCSLKPETCYVHT